MRPRNNFLEQLKSKKEAAQAAPAPKPVSEMTEAELDAEEARLREEIRRHREEAVHAGREAVSDSSTGRPRFLPKQRRRPPWR